MHRNLGRRAQRHRVRDVVLNRRDNVEPFAPGIRNRARCALVTLALPIQQLDVESPGRLRLVAGAQACCCLVTELEWIQENGANLDVSPPSVAEGSNILQLS